MAIESIVASCIVCAYEYDASSYDSCIHSISTVAISRDGGTDSGVPLSVLCMDVLDSMRWPSADRLSV